MKRITIGDTVAFILGVLFGFILGIGVTANHLNQKYCGEKGGTLVAHVCLDVKEKK